MFSKDGIYYTKSGKDLTSLCDLLLPLLVLVCLNELDLFVMWVSAFVTIDAVAYVLVYPLYGPSSVVSPTYL